MKIKSVTVRQMQKLDRTAIEKIGIPSLCLMENAGSATVQQIRKELRAKRSAQVCIFCGLGNNAGDGFVIARHLINAGIKAKVFLIGKAGKLKNDALTNFQILKKCKYPVFQINKIDENCKNHIKKADLIVDAIFGTGLSREITEPFKGVIEFLNATKKKIVSVDIPSGLDGTTGNIHGVCIKAKTTVTFACVKKGFTEKAGPQVTGKIVVADIGIPKKLIKKIQHGQSKQS